MAVSNPATNVHIAQINPNGGELFLTNRQGLQSRSVLRSAGKIYAVDWDITGTVNDTATEVEWSDGSLWNASPSDVDSLFADGFNPFPVPD